MKDVNKRNTYIVAGLFLLGLLSFCVYLFNLSRQPMNQQLSLTPRPFATDYLGKNEKSGSMISTITSTVIPTESTDVDVCGQKEAYTLLIIGSDAADLRGQPGADFIRPVRVDFSHRNISAFTLPRDLWVNTRGLGFENPTVTNAVLGTVFHEAYKRSSNVEKTGNMIDGAQASAQVILDNFGLASDHYVVVNLDQLPALIDAIGGLPIDIPEQMTDPWIGMVIDAGPQTLSGDQLMAYTRAIPDSDFNRIQRNNLVLHALYHKLLDPSVLIKMPALYNKFNKMFVTDLNSQQVFSLLCLLQEVPKEAIVMEQVKREWTSFGPSYSLFWNKEKIFSALRQLNLLPSS
jgi:LCP family protein required for cell wall assembly